MVLCTLLILFVSKMEIFVWKQEMEENSNTISFFLLSRREGLFLEQQKSIIHVIDLK